MDQVAAAASAGAVRLAPPASEAEVADFESQHGVRLPAGYRWFVTRIGNGGEGPPYYGLEPLSPRLIEQNSLLSAQENVNVHLRDEFPAEEADWTEAEPQEADVRWAAYEAGRLLLGTEGCAILWVLVLTGPAQGQVWRLGDDTATRAASSFLEWYAAWLSSRPQRREDDPVPLALRRPPSILRQAVDVVRGRLGS